MTFEFDKERFFTLFRENENLKLKNSSLIKVDYKKAIELIDLKNSLKNENHWRSRHIYHKILVQFVFDEISFNTFVLNLKINGRLIVTQIF